MRIVFVVVIMELVEVALVRLREENKMIKISNCSILHEYVLLLI